jgi:hypothetical protein
MEGNFFVPSREGSIPQGGGAGYSHLLYECFQTALDFVQATKFYNEQILVEPATVDQRCDVDELGALGDGKATERSGIQRHRFLTLHC